MRKTWGTMTRQFLALFKNGEKKSFASSPRRRRRPGFPAVALAKGGNRSARMIPESLNTRVAEKVRCIQPNPAPSLVGRLTTSRLHLTVFLARPLGFRPG